jgi:hypothetical protein
MTQQYLSALYSASHFFITFQERENQLHDLHASLTMVRIIKWRIRWLGHDITKKYIQDNNWKTSIKWREHFGDLCVHGRAILTRCEDVNCTEVAQDMIQQVDSVNMVMNCTCCGGLTAVTLQSTVFWDETPCSLVELHQRFRGIGRKSKSSK